MNLQDFKRERNYGVAIAIANALLAEGLITKNECQKLKMAFIQKYNPVIDSLQNYEGRNPSPNNNG